MSILLTGCTGFIGSRLSKLLISQGEEVRGITSKSNNTSKNLIICDLAKDKLRRSYFNGVSVVIHLAGFAHDLNQSKKNQNLCKELNIDATEKLVKVAIKMKVKKFIFISSVKAGSPNIDSLQEYLVSEPQGLYGSSKKSAEEMLLSLTKDNSMSLDIIRPALVYGPNVKGNLALMRKAINKNFFPPIPNVNNERSMVHVDDLVNMISTIMKKKSDSESNFYVITDGKRYSTREIYEILSKTLNKKIPKWGIPLFIFRLGLIFSGPLREKFKKLFGDEYYINSNFDKIGYKPNFSLYDIDKYIHI